MTNNQNDLQSNKPNDLQNMHIDPDKRDNPQETNNSNSNTGSAKNPSGKRNDTPADRAQSNEQPLNRHSDEERIDRKDDEEQEYKNKEYPHKRKTPESDDDFSHDM